MRNFKIIVQYDGAKYNGWQRQVNTKNTIQERFENVLFKMCGKNIEIFASGRTDAGVHARGQVANFKCDTEMSCNEVQLYLNKYLPMDIKVLKTEEAVERFHSRLNAVSKTYVYRIAYEKPDVFSRKYLFAAEKKPDIAKMQSAAEKLLGRHDFKGFSSVGRSKKSTVRTINFIEILDESGVVSVKINGNGFLYNMVRIISGTLYEIGIGKLEISVIDHVLETQNRELAGVTMPAQGLMLEEVFY